MEEKGKLDTAATAVYVVSVIHGQRDEAKSLLMRPFGPGEIRSDVSAGFFRIPPEGADTGTRVGERCQLISRESDESPDICDGGSERARHMVPCQY